MMNGKLREKPVEIESPHGTGFTLVELLVVMSIILILSAIALPNFLDALMKAKIARAQGDLQTISHAIEQYRTDYPEYPKSIFADLGDLEIELGIFATLTTLTTPVKYLSELPRDPFLGGNYQYFSTLINEKAELPFQRIYGEWILLSIGPDKDLNLNGITGRLIHYNPTNGMLSGGDIVRSQRETRYERN
jgi:type II secretion system protein G